MMLLILIKRTFLDAPMNDPAPDPLFLQITSTLGTLRLLMDPAMDGIGELEALPQEEMVEVLEVIGYEKRTIGE